MMWPPQGGECAAAWRSGPDPNPTPIVPDSLGLAVASLQPLPLAPAASPPNPPPVENIHLIKLEEIPDVLRWIELSERAGYVSQEKAGEWRIKIAAWKLWLELQREQAR